MSVFIGILKRHYAIDGSNQTPGGDVMNLEFGSLEDLADVTSRSDRGPQKQ